MTYNHRQISIRYQNALFLAVIGLTMLLSGTTAWLIIAYRNHLNMQAAIFKTMVTNEMREARTSLQENIAKIVAMSTQVMQEVLYKSDDITESDFKKALKKHSLLHAIGIVYEPHAFSNTKKLHSITAFKQGNIIKQASLENFYDYTQQDWFKQDIPEQGAWFNAHKDSITNTMQVRYAIPFFSYDTQLQQRIRKGIFFIDLSLESVKDLLEVLELKDAQYALLLGQNGNVLYFPGVTLRNGEIQLKDINPASYKAMLKVEEQAKRKEGGSIAYYDSISRREYQMFYEPVPGTPWLLGLVFEYKKSMHDMTYVRHHEIAIVLSVTMLLWLLIALAIGVYRAAIQRWWYISIVGSFLIFVAVASIIFLDRKNLYEIKKDHIIINTLADLQRFMLLQSKEKALAQVLYIPTGIFINSLSAHTGDMITVRGLIWQRYTLFDQDIDKGAYIGSPDETQMDVAYKQNEQSQKMGWHFKSQIASQFDYLKYPFDKQGLSLTIYDKNFTSDKILIPDFDSYDFTGRTSLLGLGKEVKLEGWDIYQSYFDYALVRYPTTFGVLDEVSKKMMPVLQFIIRLERDFVNPLIAGFLPIVIVWFLSFAVILITSLAEAASPISRVLSFIGTLFFSTVLAHLRLKTVVPSITISYMEYIYFLTYIIIFLSSVNCLVYKLAKNIPIIHTNHNIIIHLLYWPLIAFSVLGITLAIFY